MAVGGPVSASDLPPALWPSEPLRPLRRIIMDPATMPTRTVIMGPGLMRIMVRGTMDRGITPITARTAIGKTTARAHVRAAPPVIENGSRAGRRRLVD